MRAVGEKVLTLVKNTPASEDYFTKAIIVLRAREVQAALLRACAPNSWRQRLKRYRSLAPQPTDPSTAITAKSSARYASE